MALSRRTFSTAAAAAAMLPASMQTSKPNILFLMADQHRPDCVGADGNRVIHTPNLDRIAAEGVRFRHAYSSTPTCTPARAALLTGLSPWHHGLLGTGPIAQKYAYTMPQALRDNGYYTQVIGKCHYAPQRNLHGFHHAILDESGRVGSVDFRSDYRAWFHSEAPNLNPDATGVGFNDYNGKAYVLPERLHPTTWTADVATRFLETYRRSEPFFLKVSFARPHSPYDPPQRWMDRYQDAELPKPQVGKWAAKYAPRSWERNDIWHGDMGAEVRTSRQAYYGSVSFIDEQIGRILAALEKRGLLEQTLILYTSDHGDMTGDQHLWRKSYAYEASARIPMLMRWPQGLVSARRGQLSEQPVELRDIMATCLDAAGVSPARQIDGRSMLDVARGRTADWRRFIDLEHDVCYHDSNHWNALTDGKWKYIFHAQGGEEQLFDLRNDPHELQDLSGDASHSAALREWRGRMIAHFEERGEPFLKGGKLATRPRRLGFSPLYPKTPA
ncbi:MAG: arylsulfatase [Bryobacterales bacterium]|nr:arylsulfatase [Bryobacterales bacterium]